jgi:hypothetical protein
MTVSDHEPTGAAADRCSADATAAPSENATGDDAEFRANERSERTPVAGRRHTSRSFGAMGEKG